MVGAASGRELSRHRPGIRPQLQPMQATPSDEVACIGCNLGSYSSHVNGTTVFWVGADPDSDIRPWTVGHMPIVQQVSCGTLKKTQCAAASLDQCRIVATTGGGALPGLPELPLLELPVPASPEVSLTPAPSASYPSCRSCQRCRCCPRRTNCRRRHRRRRCRCCRRCRSCQSCRCCPRRAD